MKCTGCELLKCNITKTSAFAVKRTDLEASVMEASSLWRLLKTLIQRGLSLLNLNLEIKRYFNIILNENTFMSFVSRHVFSPLSSSTSRSLPISSLSPTCLPSLTHLLSDGTSSLQSGHNAHQGIQSDPWKCTPKELRVQPHKRAGTRCTEIARKDAGDARGRFANFDALSPCPTAG